MEPKSKEISIDSPKEHFECFISFLNLFSGCEFNSEKYSLSSLMFLINYFQSSLLFEFICCKIKIPQTINESIKYLSHPNCEFNENHFKESISILIREFENITIEQFQFISNSHFEIILRSLSFQIENEDFLFKLIMKLIEQDSRRKSLLKFIKFSFVSSELLKKYFWNFSVEELDFELFEALKE
jgi:hypothetical protein